MLLSSGSAFRGQEFDGVSTFAYNVTKAAVRQLATSLATRYAKDGIRVNAVAPGVTRTNQIRHFMPDISEEQQEAIFTAAASPTPLGRYGDPEEIAARSSSWHRRTRLSSPVRRSPWTAAGLRDEQCNGGAMRKIAIVGAGQAGLPGGPCSRRNGLRSNALFR